MLNSDSYIPRALHAPAPLSRLSFRDGPVACANPQCGHHWTAFLKDRRRPLFAGQWACSTRCVRALVDSAIRRELRDSTFEEVEQHRHRMPLGLILLANGWITRPQLRDALDAQQHAEARPIGQWLSEECGIAQEHIARALGMQWGCPVITKEGFDPETMALAVPRFLIETLGIVPLRVARDRVLYLACADQPDSSAALALERMSGLKVVSGLIDTVQWKSAQQDLCACASVVATVRHVTDFDTMSRGIASAIVAAQPRAARLVRLHHFFWLRLWLEAGAMSTAGGGFPRTREDVADHIYISGCEQ